MRILLVRCGLAATTLAVAAMLGLPQTAAAQQAPRAGRLAGRIIDATGNGVGGAVIRVTRGARTIVADGLGEGTFRVDGVSAGPWIVAIRCPGFIPAVLELEIPAGGLLRDFTLARLSATPDAVLLASGWAGIRGVVADARRNTPLPGASVRFLGSDAVARTDSTGAFALPAHGGRAVVLRIERAGFATRIVSATVPDSGYLVADIALDTTRRSPRDVWQWRDLDQRLKFATPRAAHVGRLEIAASAATTLLGVLETTPSMVRKGVIVRRSVCLFVDGQPRPGLPPDAIRADEVEFVEAYPAGTELTRTLASRWPPGAACGATDGIERASNERNTAQFVSVWLRAR